MQNSYEPNFYLNKRFFEQILRIYPIEYGLKMKFIYRFGKILEDDMDQKE